MLLNESIKSHICFSAEYFFNVCNDWLSREAEEYLDDLFMVLFIAPSAPPTGISASSNHRARRLDIRWNKPACGKRNSLTQKYKVEIESSRGIKVNTFERPRARYAGFRIGEQFIVRVAATNSHGSGPYSSKFKGKF